MKQKLPLLLVCLSISAAWRTGAAQTLDPTFASFSIYAPGLVYAALEQPDGKRVVTGNYSRLNGAPAYAMSRFNTNGTLDAAFQQNIGVSTSAYRVRLLSNGKFLLGNSTGAPFTVGGISRQTMAQVNADGTGDATFSIGTGPAYGTTISYVDDYLPLANGQIIAVGGWDHFNGVAAPSGIIRLSATGAIDPTFAPGTGAGVNDDIESIAALPSGKFLVGGYLSTYNGTVRNGIACLNADGTLDATFNAGLDDYSEVANIVVQPDGKILVSGFVDYTTTRGYSRGIARLNADGTLDTSFTPPGTLQGNGTLVYSYSGDAMQLQADGKILVNSLVPVGGTNTSRVARLNSDGSLDASFQAGAGPNAMPRSIKLLSNGNVLVMGNFTSFNGVADRPLIELTSSGAMVASPPVFQTTGSVAAVVRQTDGKLIAGGNFSEINGQSIRRVARFNTNGTLDSSFPTSVGYEGNVADLAIQPDGRFLAAGQGFLQRYLTTGAPDNTFTSPGFSSSTPKLLLQADGRVLLGSTTLNMFNPTTGSSTTPGFVRLLTDGSRDNTFVPAVAGSGRFSSFAGFALQPNGKIVVAGTFVTTSPSSRRTVMRLETTGAVDASFAGGTIVGNPSSSFISLAVQNDGKVLMGGLFTTYDGTARTSVARLNTDGTLDAGFVPPVLSGTVTKVLVQPNGRILLAGSVTGAGLPNYLMRLLATGAADASYAATAVPNSTVNSLLIQPDGGIVANGSFTTINGQPAQGLARITASNVLHVQAPQAVAEQTLAWPVPAHTTLTVAPDANAHPQALDLLDVLGRAIRHQDLRSAAPATLALENLPAGTYLLRVTYAEGLVTRRVQIQ